MTFDLDDPPPPPPLSVLLKGWKIALAGRKGLADALLPRPNNAKCLRFKFCLRLNQNFKQGRLPSRFVGTFRHPRDKKWHFPTTNQPSQQGNPPGLSAQRPSDSISKTLPALRNAIHTQNAGTYPAWVWGGVGPGPNNPHPHPTPRSYKKNRLPFKRRLDWGIIFPHSPAEHF